MPIVRRALPILLACLVMAALAPAALAKKDGGCPNGGFDTLEVATAADYPAAISAYPSVQRALADGVYTAADLVAQFPSLDKNGNGVVCIKDIYTHTGGRSAGFFYFVSAVDDHAAAP